MYITKIGLLVSLFCCSYNLLAELVIRIIPIAKYGDSYQALLELPSRPQFDQQYTYWQYFEEKWPGSQEELSFKLHFPFFKGAARDLAQRVISKKTNIFSSIDGHLTIPTRDVVLSVAVWGTRTRWITYVVLVPYRDIPADQKNKIRWFTVLNNGALKTTNEQLIDSDSFGKWNQSNEVRWRTIKPMLDNLAAMRQKHETWFGGLWSDIQKIFEKISRSFSR